MKSESVRQIVIELDVENTQIASRNESLARVARKLRTG